MTGTDALAVLPHSVVFAIRKLGTVTALPVKIPHPERALVLLSSARAMPSPALAAFAAHLRDSFRDLRHLIKRHEEAVIWSA